MSQWNNSYVYNNVNNQYQGGDSWNGDLNSQYVNQGYYPNRQQYDSNQQYVSFNEFINQMQTNGAAQPSGSTYNNVQYPNYGQYDYQNMPSTSQNAQLDTFYAANSSTMADGAEGFSQNQYEAQPPEGSYSNELILNSILTPTATEFVPKTSSVKQSTSAQNVPESTNVNTNNSSSNNGPTEYKKPHGSSSDTNWRERPQSSQQQNGDSKHNKYESNNRHQDGYRHQENRDNSNRNRDRNRYHDSNSHNNYESNSRSSRNYDSDRRNNDTYESRSGHNYESSSRNSHNYESNNRSERNQSKTNSKSKNKDPDARTFYNSSINKGGQDYRNGKGEGSGRNRNWAGSQRLRGAERNYSEEEQYANSYLQYRDEKAERMSKSDSSSPKFRGKQTAVVEAGM